MSIRDILAIISRQDTSLDTVLTKQPFDEMLYKKGVVWGKIVERWL